MRSTTVAIIALGAASLRCAPDVGETFPHAILAPAKSTSALPDADLEEAFVPDDGASSGEGGDDAGDSGDGDGAEAQVVLTGVLVPLHERSPACLECATLYCAQYVTGCDTLGGQVEAGPAAGT